MLKQGEDVQMAKKKITAKAQLSKPMVEARQRLVSLLGAKVQLTCSANGKGKICIPFADEAELERIMAALGRPKA